MSRSNARPARKAKSGGGRLDSDDFFGMQPTSTTDLPDPIPLLHALSRAVLEVLAGPRDLDQLARWVSDDVYRQLMKRVIIAGRARQLKGQAPQRPQFQLGATTVCEPRDGIIEGVVIVHGRARSRAIAIRLEGLDLRWRASAVHVL